MKIKFLLLCLTLHFICASITVFAQSTTSEAAYKVEAYRMPADHHFKLDGRLDEPFWQYITPITQFTQQEPVEGGQPSEETVIYIAFDDQYLYIAAILFDSQPDRILAYQKRRNESLETDDRFMWTLDTFNDGRSAYFFETNPAGLRGDGLLTTSQGINLNKSWDGIWDVRTSVNEEGWIVEIRIPFRTLDFNPDQSVWGINFQRTIRRNNEEILWAGWRRNQGLFRPQNTGQLVGITGINQGLGLEITPYATTGNNRTWSADEATGEWKADAGFDASYNISPSIRTSLTVNTDFAETEVDQRRVNLTRFPLFFLSNVIFFWRDPISSPSHLILFTHSSAAESDW